MGEITRQNWDGINFKKLTEHSKELEEYDGELPLRLYDYININNTINYLNKRGKEYEYPKMQEYRKKQDAEQDVMELIEFVNNNQEFEDIIKIKK